MNAQEMWGRYSAKYGINTDYQAWAFGADPDELARLVLAGIKTGTASAHFWYILENLELPKVGEYSVILNSKEEAVCIIRTTKVYIVPFEEVSKEHAYREGEGDRSLSYWRSVHEDYFKTEFQKNGLTFDNQINVVCEEFVRVFP